MHVRCLGNTAGRKNLYPRANASVRKPCGYAPVLTTAPHSPYKSGSAAQSAQTNSASPQQRPQVAQHHRSAGYRASSPRAREVAFLARGAQALANQDPTGREAEFRPACAGFEASHHTKKPRSL